MQGGHLPKNVTELIESREMSKNFWEKSFWENVYSYFSILATLILAHGVQIF